MSTISVDVSSARIPVLQVGYQGENEVTDVLFDISSWITEYGEGTVQLRVKRPQNSEDQSYLLSLPISSGVATWTVSELDTANKGNGKAQINYLVGTAIKDSVIYPYKVGKSIIGSDSPVDPFYTWVERAKAWAIGKLLDDEDVPASDETHNNNAKYFAERIKAWAIGKLLDGTDVPSTDETYHNNSKYWSEQAHDYADVAVAYADTLAVAPKVANSAADMTDTSKVYVFVGTTTSSLTNGHWYYYKNSAWTDGGAYIASAIPTDTTLLVSGAAADAKVAGDKITELESAYDDLAQSYIVKSIAGVSLLDGYDTSALDVVKCIKDVTISAVQRGTTEGELPTFRIKVCTNTESYPKYISIESDEGRGTSFAFGDSDTAEASVQENGNTNKIKIRFDWDSFTGNYNKTYANSKIEFVGTTISERIEQNKKCINNVVNTINNIVEIGPILPMNAILSRYIDYEGKIVEYTNHNNWIIKTYQITSGETVIAYGDDVKLSSNYVLMMFANSYTVGTIGNIIKRGSATETDYKFTYTAEANGYIIIAMRTDAGYGELKLYSSFNTSELLDPETGAKFVTPMTGTSYASTYIDSNNRIVAGPEGFTMKKYAVTGGKTYRLKGKWSRLNYSSYPIACFAYDEYTGTPPFQCNTAVIPAGDTATAKLYDVPFTPTLDGYLYVVEYSLYPGIDVYEGVDYRQDSVLVNTLTNTKKDYPVKMQLFGDSITDDSWRDDGTWATIFANYFPQRFWNISNDAVGGSHMGHGKVNGETGKYHDLEYNYVYDLITNEDIFKPDSDIIVVFAGTNDFNSSPLGQYGDTTTATFYGAVRCVCEYLSSHTAAKCFFVTPIARPTDADSTKETNADGEKINAYGATLRNYADAIKQTCAFFQFPVIDLFYEIGWNATNVKPYMDPVGVHPNALGSQVISQLITGKIKEHFAL